MLTRSQLLLSRIKELFEELFFPTAMNLREMTQSECHLYKTTNFPDASSPCIGSFLNVTWIAILDYSGLRIRSVDGSSNQYFIPARLKSSVELVNVYASTLDTLVSMTTEGQLFDGDFLKKHGFLPYTNPFG